VLLATTWGLIALPALIRLGQAFALLPR